MRGGTDLHMIYRNIYLCPVSHARPLYSVRITRSHMVQRWRPSLQVAIVVTILGDDGWSGEDGCFQEGGELTERRTPRLKGRTRGFNVEDVSDWEWTMRTEDAGPPRPPLDS